MLVTVRAIRDRVLTVLMSVYLSLCEVAVQKVTAVVDLVMYNKSGDILN